MMRNATREKVRKHYERAGLTPARGGDAESCASDCWQEKERSDNYAGEKGDPEMERESYGVGNSPHDKAS
jgi:hypothetical protein